MAFRVCPKCGKKAECKDSRQLEAYVSRRYHCVKGHRFTSVEVIVEDPSHGGNALEQMREIYRAEGRDQMRSEFREMFGVKRG